GGITGYARVTVTGLSETWTGLGTTNNWSDPANWSGNQVPGPSTMVSFSDTSTKDALVDPAFAGLVASIVVEPGCTGTITLDRNFYVLGPLYLSAGPFNPNGYGPSVGIGPPGSPTNTTTAGSIVAGGTFNGSSGSVYAANLTLSRGTFNAP